MLQLDQIQPGISFTENGRSSKVRDGFVNILSVVNECGKHGYLFVEIKPFLSLR